LVDSGASLSFVDSIFANKIGLQKWNETKEIIAETIDGRTLSSGTIRYYSQPKMQLNGHCFQPKLRHIQSPHFNIILGMDWLMDNIPFIHWKTRTLDFKR
ncbi:hypothetical protein ROZALSC1DRAFT_3526, partial [Rozella allomycis CSF55]